jgi:hypothetical protein
MSNIFKKMSFTDYYKSLPDIQVEIRDRICDRLEFNSKKTFYNKLNNNSWSAIEREAVEQIVTDFELELINLFK